MCAISKAAGQDLLRRNPLGLKCDSTRYAGDDFTVSVTALATLPLVSPWYESRMAREGKLSHSGSVVLCPKEKHISCPPGRPGPCRPGTRPPTPTSPAWATGLEMVVSAAAWDGRSRAVGHTNKVPPHQVLLTVPSSGSWAASRSAPSAPSAPSQQHLQTGVPLSNCPAAGGCAKGGPVGLRDSPGVGTASSASHSNRDTSGGLGLHAAWRCMGCFGGPSTK